MMQTISRTAVACLFILSVVQVHGSPYSKYGRSCQDIGCRPTEVCVMAEDPCSYGRQSDCGRYPTCKKDPNAEISCRTKLCGGGQRCVEDARGAPSCIDAPDERFGKTRGKPNRVIPPSYPNRVIPPSYPNQGHRFSGGGFGRPAWSSGRDDINGRSGPARGGRPINTQGDGLDLYPPVLDIFAEYNGGAPKDVSRRQSSGNVESSAPGGARTSESSGYPAGSGYPASSSNGGSTGGSSGYPAGSGYPSGSSSGYPSRSSSGYPTGSGYPAGTSSGGSGYPGSSSSGYPSSSSVDNTAKRTSVAGVNSGYPSGSSGYPSSPSGYPSGSSGYPSGSSGYPSGSSGYPSRSSGYPSGGSSSGYPGSSPNNDVMRRTSSSSVNAGYPSSGNSGYPSNGGYQGQPNRGYYPSQSNGYPGGQYNNNGGQQYPGSNPQQGYQNPGYYDNRGYPNGNPAGGYPGQQQPPKKPSITEQISNYAKNLAQRVLTQTIINQVSGRH